MKKIKVTFLISKLSAGGAERVIAALINNLSKEKYDISLIVVNNSKLHYKLDNSVNIYNLNTNLLLAPLKIRRKLNLIKPDVVVSTVSYFNIYISLIKCILPKNIVYIARESNILKLLNKDESFLKGFVMGTFLSKLFYKNGFNFFIAQTDAMKLEMNNFSNIELKKIRVIGNPFIDNQIKIKPYTKIPKIKLLSIGRLHPQKGYFRIFKALEMLDIDFEYLIIGKGPLEKKLRNYLSTSNIGNKIIFSEIISNEKVKELMVNYDMLLLGSHHEGFPNVVLEATNYNLPTISFKCNNCLNGVVLDGLNGYITHSNKLEDFNDNIKKVINNQYDIVEGKIILNEKFNLNKIVNSYDELLSDINNFKK